MQKIVFISLLTILSTALIIGYVMLKKMSKNVSSSEILIPKIQEVSNIDQIVAPYLEHKTTKGLSVGIYKQGKIDYYNYGICSEENPVTPTEHSIYEIGSITKTFTGLLFAQMLEEGKVHADDPISKFLPKEIVHWDDSLQITLTELVSHSSGLPRIPKNLYLQMFKHMDNPYKEYTEEDLYAFLNKYTPLAKSDRKVDYSNLGMGLLGNILAQVDGVDYASLVENRILSPLQMDASFAGYKPNKQITGHNGFGEPTAAWEEQTLEGAGAIRSNTADMMKYLKANLKVSGTIVKSHQVIRADNAHMQVAMGWHILYPKSNNLELLFHNGGSGGFRSVILISKEHQTGVVILSNCIESVDEIGIRIMEFISEVHP